MVTLVLHLATATATPKPTARATLQPTATPGSGSGILTLASFSPTQGDFGYRVTLTGSGFTGATEVTFNGVAASSVTVNSDGQITVTAPSGASSGPIRVFTPAGSATSSGSFTFYKRPSFPGLADSTNNVHLYIPFDNNVSNPADLTTSKPPIDLVWGWNNGASTQYPSVYKLFYLPYDVEEEPASYPQAHDLAWYKANHPDWIEYQCDRTTVAWEFGSTTATPLDFSNPAEQQYIEQTYLVPELQSGTGYRGIAFDDPNFQNAGSWTGQRCGHYDLNGNWVQQYNGTDNDPAYRQDIINWAANMQSWMHQHEPGKMMAVNFSFDPSYAADSATLLSHIDFDEDEQGFTNGNNADPTNPSNWKYTDGQWLAKMQQMEAYLQHGGGWKDNNQEPVSFGQVTNAQVQWALANYFLVKNNASGLWICGYQQYGTLFNRPEYAAAKVGSATDDMHADQGTYARDFTNGLTLVNPSSTSSVTVLLTGTYHDLYGNVVSGSITLAPASGIVLLNG